MGRSIYSLALRPDLSSRRRQVLRLEDEPIRTQTPCHRQTSPNRLNSTSLTFKRHRRRRRHRTICLRRELASASATSKRKLPHMLLAPICCWLLFYSISLVACNDETAGSKLRITIQPQDLVAIEGESTELNCAAEAEAGEQEPTIEWFHNGQLIRSSSQSRTTMGGSIQLLDVRPPGDGTPSDAGRYQCVARGNGGAEARSRNATLQVACK